MKIAILEDEKLTAKDLARTIQAIEPDIEIVAMLHSLEEAMAYFKNKPDLDLVFSDIELGDGLSFEVFEKCQVSTPIIFCTAYDHYALEAFKTVGIDYILKPFSKNMIEKALDKFQSLKANLAGSAVNPQMPNLLEFLKNQLVPSKTPSVIIQQGDKIIPLDGETIALFYIDETAVFAYTFERKRHILNQKLDVLEQIFGKTFFRANRQHLVNRKAVKDASHYFNRKIMVNLTIAFDEQIIIGKLKTTAFLDWLALC